MTLPAPIPVFDGHNDVLLRLWQSALPAPETAFLQGTGTGHLDLPRARAGGFAGGLFAVYVPSPPGASDAPATPSQQDALATTIGIVALLARLERASRGAVRQCRSVADIRAAMAGGALAVVLHVEGAEMIGADLAMLDVLHQAGLRSIGPVWSRPNIFGHGVPFRFPSGPDIGPGLTEAGRDLVRACNERRILIDLSHLNEQGFWDVAKLSRAPLVASHSNAHALTPHSRNLTDRQLDAIRDSDGFVGVVFGAMFSREDGRKDPDTPLDAILRHVDYLVERIGLERVGFGSDFDGTTVPADLGDVAGLPKLVEGLRARGYDEAALRRVCHENWLAVLERTWGG